jgi:hypothetical protein
MAGLGGFALQKAVFHMLKADSALMAMVSGVFDQVPQKTAYPYVVLQEWVAKPLITQTQQASRHTMLWQVWSVEGGRKQALLIMERLQVLLQDAALRPEGQVLVWMRCGEAELQLMDDGKTYRGALGCDALTHSA